ncbi:ATP-dependent helicase (plasmid) [Halorussus limi]|uniref:DNA 3'-5' helicase n=1 Tax=Halorussus limi TaxID=2938695 RepID=A0A8U0I260_9EURY|nr:ATP-dependent DNA helicase [Halorussus limi]UPV77143.1 ATP-dependent helicase [Halorussus limi]
MTEKNAATPDWLPTPEDDFDPKPQQETIIESEDYPMRVLAGAGTGKTFTMVRKIEHLVDEQGVSPDRILALTFTNNAADSMREKLNAKLGAAGYDIDAYTYHSICNELLTDYAYEAGLDPDFEVATDAETYAICLDVLDEIEYRSVKPNVYGPDSYATGAASKLRSFIGSMKRSGISPEEIDDYLGSAERVYELAEIPDRIEASASNHLGGRSVSTVLDGIPDVCEEIRSIRDKLGEEGIEASVADLLDRLMDLCDALEAAFEAHEAGEHSLPDAAHKLPKYLLGGYASGAPSGIPDDLDLELTDELRTFTDECKTALDLNAGYAAYERELEARDLLDFDGLVVEAERLLNSSVGEEIADRWDYVFCDEFQDTDRLQFDLVTSLVSEDRLFVVGDDDQAIYEWRGAHVANITDELDAEFGDDLADEPLEQNFRSHQPILDLANEALERLDERESEKTLTRVEEPDYDGTFVATVEEADDEDERVGQLVTVVRNLLSGEAADLDRAYDPGEIALFVRKNDHATPILEAFDRAGIPYQVAGDLASESVGVGTVVAYLKALARPDDEVSWNRVLTMRYRLADADLRRLNDHDDGVLAGLREIPLDAFEEPDRVREARTHAAELLELRETASLAHLYRELKDLTNVEWYLSEQERRDLTQVEEVIEQYGDGAVQPPLTPEFIDSLEHYDSLLDESGSSPTSQPDLADAAVNVMTVHKSKGLDFPVVLMPRLTADEWEPDSRTYDTLETALSGDPDSAFREDLVARDARETRRVLHVGVTRAEELLVLQGRAPEGESDNEREVHEAVAEILPETAPWRPGSGHLPIWSDLQESLPETATEWTDSLASTVVGDVGGEVRYDGDVLSATEGREKVLAIAGDSVAGELDRTDRAGLFEVETIGGVSKADPPIRHSYTSLERYEQCPRQHYLDFVVDAFPDYWSGSPAGDETGGVSQHEVGLLFHDVAEMANRRGVTTPDVWYELCDRLAGQRHSKDTVDAVRACIDRYFELEVSEWELLDAEREFELTLDGHELVGFVDAVYRNPEDELVVVDYKATERHRDIENDRQLPLYLLACRDLYDEPVSKAGYAYVGAVGPKLETSTFGETELDTVRSALTETMNDIESTAFDKYRAGTHCRWCQHNGLPCAERK